MDWNSKLREKEWNTHAHAHTILLTRLDKLKMLYTIYSNSVAIEVKEYAQIDVCCANIIFSMLSLMSLLLCPSVSVHNLCRLRLYVLNQCRSMVRSRKRFETSSNNDMLHWMGQRHTKKENSCLLVDVTNDFFSVTEFTYSVLLLSHHIKWPVYRIESSSNKFFSTTATTKKLKTVA